MWLHILDCLFPFQAAVSPFPTKPESWKEGGGCLSGRGSGNSAMVHLPSNFPRPTWIWLPDWTSQSTTDHVKACPNHSMLLHVAYKVKGKFLGLPVKSYNNQALTYLSITALQEAYNETILNHLLSSAPPFLCTWNAPSHVLKSSPFFKAQLKFHLFWVPDHSSSTCL